MSLIPQFIVNAVQALNNTTHIAVTISEGIDLLSEETVKISTVYLQKVKEDIQQDLEVTKL